MEPHWCAKTESTLQGFTLTSRRLPPSSFAHDTHQPSYLLALGLAQCLDAMHLLLILLQRLLLWLRLGQGLGRKGHGGRLEEGDASGEAGSVVLALLACLAASLFPPCLRRPRLEALWLLSSCCCHGLCVGWVLWVVGWLVGGCLG